MSRPRCFGVGVVLLLGIYQSFPQGQITFNNRVNNVVVAPVYGLESTNVHLAIHGNTASGTPAGTQTYTGPLIGGASFTAQLFAGPTNAADIELIGLYPQVNFRTNDSAGFVIAPPFAVRVPSVPEGERARVQLRAWDNRAGTVTNWQDVLADNSIERGQSLSFISEPLGGVHVTPPNLIGLESFNLTLGEPLRLEIRLTNSIPELLLYGAPGLDYQIEFRPAFDIQFPWQAFTNFVLPSSPSAVQDPTATGAVTRFYRAVRNP